MVDRCHLNNIVEGGRVREGRELGTLHVSAQATQAKLIPFFVACNKIVFALHKNRPNDTIPS